MKLSADVLLEAISHLATWQKTGDDNEACYSFPLFSAEHDSASGHVLILSPEDASVLPAGRDVLAVFTAPPHPGMHRVDCPALIPDAAIHPGQLRQCLTALYDRLERWAEALSVCSADLAGVRQMLEVSAAEMNGDFVLIDVSYHVPACTNTGASAIDAIVDLRNGRATEGTIALLADDPRITEIAREKGVRLYESELKSYHARKTLYRNMFRNGESVFYNRLLFCRMSEAYGETDRFMLECLAQRVERITEHLLTYDVPLSRFMALKQQLLRVPSPDFSGDLAAISPLGWKEDDDYRFYIFRSFYVNRDDGISDYILRSLEQIIPESCGAMDGDRILLLQNITHSDITPAELRQRLSAFLRESLYKVGISNEFHSFRLLRGAYFQADAALSRGEQRDPTLWYYPFENYLSDYLFWKVAADIPGEMLIPPGLERLRQLDHGKGTDYTETLRVLAEVNFNTTHAAEALYIHRTTLQNRLERIQRLADLDLNNSDMRFLLQFSFRLLAQK